MRRTLVRTTLILALALGVVVLLVGGVTDTRADEAPESARTAEPEPAPVAEDPYPLQQGPTADEVQLIVFERAYSECASADLDLLASKYKSADTSKRGVAAAVGRAWASYFKAGADAVQDGRDGCLQGQAQRSG